MYLFISLKNGKILTFPRLKDSPLFTICVRKFNLYMYVPTFKRMCNKTKQF